MYEIELINTGTELLLGRILNSHQAWLCRQLVAKGYSVRRQVTVEDESEEIKRAVAEAAARADLILTTGGLGPTSDDLTRQAIAELAGRTLAVDDGVRKAIDAYFHARGKPPPRGVEVQALVPEGALVLPNRAGTAPGLAFQLERAGRDEGRPWLIMLPGPPRELYPMFETEVIPLLQKHFPLETTFGQRTLRVTGLGESVVESRIKGSLADLVAGGLMVGYCARIGEVEVRLAARGKEPGALTEKAASIVRERLGGHIFSEAEEGLEEVVVKLLRDQRRQLALAESCTGGYIAHRITNVPGASEVLGYGLVVYSNAAKEDLIEVHPETIAGAGAVSEATAREMAEGVRARAQSDYGLGVTGIAGPGGGSADKPVGTVYIALATARGTKVFHFDNPYDRETFKFVTSQQALDLLRRALLDEPEVGGS